MIHAFMLAAVVSTPGPREFILVHSPRGSTVKIVYRLMPSPHEAVGPIIGDGKLHLTSNGRSHSYSLSQLHIASQGSVWTQFITDPKMACYAEPVSFSRASNGHEEVTVRYADVGKGCHPKSTVIDAVTGAILSTQ